MKTIILDLQSQMGVEDEAVRLLTAYLDQHEMTIARQDFGSTIVFSSVLDVPAPAPEMSAPPHDVEDEQEMTVSLSTTDLGGMFGMGANGPAGPFEETLTTPEDVITEEPAAYAEDITCQLLDVSSDDNIKVIVDPSRARSVLHVNSLTAEGTVIGFNVGRSSARFPKVEMFEDAVPLEQQAEPHIRTRILVQSQDGNQINTRTAILAVEQVEEGSKLIIGGDLLSLVSTYKTMK